jgi:MFS family permease
LRHRQFALLWTGAFTSNIGTWMETVAVGILVQTSTNKATWSGLVLAAGFAPNGLLGPIGGALADRMPRRVLLLMTTTVQTALAGTLAALAAFGKPAPWLVVLIVFLSGCANAIGFPAYQALLPDLVPVEDLAGAVALSSAQWNLGRVIGPALAGVVIALGSYASAFTINTLSFFAVIFVLLALRLPAPEREGHAPLLQSIRDGMRFSRADPGLRVALVVIGFAAFLTAPFIAMVPAFGDKVFHDPTTGTAALVTAQGIGAVAMGLALGPLHARFGNRRTLLAAATLLPLALVGYASAPSLWLGVVGIAFVGFLYLGLLSSCTTIAQLRAPTYIRGRVLSLLMAILGILYPIGTVTQGALGDSVGLRVTTIGAASLFLLAVVGMRVTARPWLARLDDEPTAVGSVTRATESPTGDAVTPA